MSASLMLTVPSWVLCTLIRAAGRITVTRFCRLTLVSIRLMLTVTGSIWAVLGRTTILRTRMTPLMMSCVTAVRTAGLRRQSVSCLMRLQEYWLMVMVSPYLMLPRLLLRRAVIPGRTLKAMRAPRYLPDTLLKAQTTIRRF